MKLFVAGFPNDFDDTDLKEMFELYGNVLSARFVIDRATGRNKGFGFIDMPDKMEALQTIETLNGAAIKGKKILVQEAEDKGAGGGNNFRSRDNRDSRDNFNKRRY